MTSDSITEQAARALHEAMPVSPRETPWDDLTDVGKDYWRQKVHALADAGLLAHQAPATEDGPTLPALLREYGDAIRGDWSDIDGRSVRDDLDAFASWSASGALPATARQTLGICPTGGGHWEQHCEPECDPPVTPEPSGFEGTRSALSALTIRKDQTDD